MNLKFDRGVIERLFDYEIVLGSVIGILISLNALEYITDVFV